ncbi:dimethyladenosine transferase 2, mitochondrial [Scaptodrosophila lebanonensis]|uniref:rRNA adenine N(6)-methyltransferase n=1 Tax=Drosophila lebanonensis TaxID=7225 RepID=A0A6J2TKL2_DROLE|nr:dimethyladenosine transferase 2, mitochondrial [Scaptodrosophila lebanonensis]
MLKMFPMIWSCSIRRANNLAVKYSTKAKRAQHAEKLARYSHEFPEKLLNKKQKIPAHMYVANSELAQQISDYLDPHLQRSRCDTVVELNPGVGHFTRHLLDRETQFRRIILIECMEYFLPRLQEIHTLYPERVKVRHGDFVNLWKLAYMDKLDNGTRLAELLHDVPQKAYNDEPNMLVFGAVGSYQFFQHLINSLVFQNSIYSLGRCEMILALPPPIYVHLTCSNEIGYLIYRSTTILFQILFEHRFIAKVPRDHFLPTQADYNLNKSSKLAKVRSIHPEYLYLVKFVPRPNLHELCAPHDLPALWFFIKQNFVSRRNRIVPNLEKWVPGCGPRLIINSEKCVPVNPLNADESSSKLPQYSTVSTTMSTQDYFPGINIYTQFGDLRPSQVLTLFSQFRRWPEYEESSFLASLENTILKLETSSDEQTIEESVILQEEDDITVDSVEELLEETPKSVRSHNKSKINK